MSRGLGSTGKPFINANTGTDEYTSFTAKRKGKKKPIDLKDKGDFQRDIFIDVRTDTFVLDSADEKTNKLIAQFGEEIFGLSYDSRVIVKPIIQHEIVNVTKLKLSIG